MDSIGEQSLIGMTLEKPSTPLIIKSLKNTSTTAILTDEDEQVAQCITPGIFISV
jgi:hypothetical protein